MNFSQRDSGGVWASRHVSLRVDDEILEPEHDQAVRIAPTIVVEDGDGYLPVLAGRFCLSKGLLKPARKTFS